MGKGNGIIIFANHFDGCARAFVFVHSFVCEEDMRAHMKDVVRRLSFVQVSACPLRIRVCVSNKRLRFKIINECKR